MNEVKRTVVMNNITQDTVLYKLNKEPINEIVKNIYILVTEDTVFCDEVMDVISKQKIVDMRPIELSNMLGNNAIYMSSVNGFLVIDTVTDDLSRILNIVADMYSTAIYSGDLENCIVSTIAMDFMIPAYCQYEISYTDICKGIVPPATTVVNLQRSIESMVRINTK